ncbi:NAD-dependent epimerase/dehydratase family protein [Cysteiniphilum litorale]|uniref:NAD-dependent epimerase/dehydratase family protein n=1 Tax=Cysteiniphilum litorale TaxID=2056700 RepID=UPI003F8806BF
MGRKILVIGGTQYFGKHLVRQLIEAGDNVTIASRGNNPAPKSCLHVYFDREKRDSINCVLDRDWDITYDQSCYSSNNLDLLSNVIKNSGAYIMTSSQAVYPNGSLLKENLTERHSVDSYSNCINSYGQEKLKSERYIQSLNKNSIFPRFPVVIGKNDPRMRLQSIIAQISTKRISIPIKNPAFNIICEDDAATALFLLAKSQHIGAINIAAEGSLEAEQMCLIIAKLLNIDLSIFRCHKHNYSPFDLIKESSKTLCLDTQ